MALVISNVYYFGFLLIKGFNVLNSNLQDLFIYKLNEVPNFLSIPQMLMLPSNKNFHFLDYKNINIEDDKKDKNLLTVDNRK